jgi:hypothetical protein
MFWPFRKFSHKTDSLARGSTADTADPFYVSRPRIEKAVSEALALGDNLVIYGPPHLGKTMLLNRELAATDAIHLGCRPGFKRTQIYRVALSSLGYAFLVEKKRRGKASTTVKFGLGGTGVKAGAEGEMEQVMHPVSVDLKNPSEVAHLISRIKQLPWLVLDNFQLLDNKTKKNLLFDLAFLSERPGLRVIISGAWSREDYLEEIEPAVTDKFKYVFIPPWSEAELRAAAAQWAARSKAFSAIKPLLDEIINLAEGDISLFRALVEASVDKVGAAPSSSASSSAVLPIQEVVIGRFRRGLSTKLKPIFAQREIYVKYLSLQTTARIVMNPKFQPIRNATQGDYAQTTIDPATNQPYEDGRVVLLDSSGNPQYIRQDTSKIVDMQADIVRFLLRKFHGAVQQGAGRIKLTNLVQEFAEQLARPIALNESRLRAVFKSFDEVQRQALVVPSMLAVHGTDDAMEIVDRRLFLFLQSVSIEDLEDLLDNVQPRKTPNARRRNRLSPEMEEDQKNAYIAQLAPQLSEAASSGLPVERPAEVNEPSLPKSQVKVARPRPRARRKAANA